VVLCQPYRPGGHLPFADRVEQALVITQVPLALVLSTIGAGFAVARSILQTRGPTKSIPTIPISQDHRLIAAPGDQRLMEIAGHSARNCDHVVRIVLSGCQIRS